MSINAIKSIETEKLRFRKKTIIKILKYCFLINPFIYIIDLYI